MAIYATYLQDWENNSLAEYNPDGWTTNDNSRGGLQRFSNPTYASNGSFSLSKNTSVFTEVTASKTLAGLTVGRVYTVNLKVRSQYPDAQTVQLGVSGKARGTAVTVNAAYTTFTVTYTFTATATSHVLQLFMTDVNYSGDTLFIDEVKVTWSDATANTVSTPSGLVSPSDFVAGSSSQPLSWTFNDPQKATGDRQTAFQVVIYKDDVEVHDSAKITAFDDQTYYVNSDWDPGVYTWKVRTWDLSDAVSSYSSLASFNVTYSYNIQQPPIITAWDTTRASNAELAMSFQYRNGDPGFSDPMSGAALYIKLVGSGPGVYAFAGSWPSGTLPVVGGPENYSILLPAGTLAAGSYDVQLDTVDTYPGIGQSATTTLTVIAPPNAPTLNPHGMFYSTQTVGLSWNYNASDTSGPQSQYAIYIKPAGGSETQITSGYGTATTYTVPANTFTAGLEYTWRVVTYGQGGGQATSTWGAVNLAYVNDPPTVTMNPITFFNATANKTISWVYDGNDVNDPQSKYRVVIKEGSTVVHDTGTVTSASNSYTIPANTLTNGKTYNVQVTVTDTRWSESVITIGGTVITPAAAVPFTWETTDGWTVNFGSLAVNSENPRTGSSSLYMLRSSGGGQVSIRKTVSGFEVGKEHTVSMYVAVKASSAVNTTTVSIGGVNQSINIPASGAVPSAYQQITVTFTPATPDLTLTVISQASNQASTRLYVDDIVVSRSQYSTEVETAYNTVPATGTSPALAFKTNYTPTNPTVVHRTDFLAQNTALLDWNFVDSNTDQGDAQTAYRVVITRTSDSVEVVDTGKVASATTAYTIPAATLAEGVTYRWQVYVWDSFDFMSAPSAPDTFNTAAAVTIEFSAPVDGVVLDTNAVTVTWTVATFGSDTQAKRQIKVYRTDTGALVTDTGLVSSTSKSYNVTGLVSDVLYRIEVQIQSAAGVNSNVIQVTVFPDYVNPNEPTAILSTMGAQVMLSITNPTATGLRPAVVVNEVWRAPSIGLESGKFVKIGETTPNGTYTDYLVGANSTYLYQIKAVTA